MLVIVVIAAIFVALGLAKLLTRRTCSNPTLLPLSTKLDADASTAPQEKKIILVTGGNGFLGAECVKHILKASDFDEVRVLDLFDRNLPQDDRINFIKGSVNDFELCLKSVEGVSAVLHIAAVVDLRSTAYFHNLMRTVNVAGTWNVLEACLRKGVKSFVYTSSNSSLSSSAKKVEISNEKEVLECWNTTKADTVYGMTKREAAQLTLEADNRNGVLRTVVLIPGPILGPKEPRMLHGILTGELTRLYDTPTSGSLNFIWSKSFARAQLLAAKALLSPPESETLRNVAGHAFMIHDFYDNCPTIETEIRTALGVPEGNYLPFWAAGAINKFAEMLNWVTNDHKNWQLLQATSAATKFVRDPPLMTTCEPLQKAIGWKPATKQEMLKDLADFYSPHMKPNKAGVLVYVPPTVAPSSSKKFD